MRVELGAVPVEFPYEPYECQQKFMRNVLDALQARKNALLESPTGTGKTLSLLCSALAYVQERKSKFKLDGSNFGEFLEAGGAAKADPKGGSLRARLFPQVIYASRTHSQLKQVVRELNKTVYRSTVTVAFLAGRDQLCLNERVKKQTSTHIKSQMCRRLIGGHKCVFHNNIRDKDPENIIKTYAAEGDGHVLDIEDLVQAGKTHQHCPFFLNRNLQPRADLVLMPYNYVLDPKIRESFNVNIKGNIVIFDEAHNLGQIAESSVSMSLTSADLAACIKQTQECLQKMVDEAETAREEFDNSATPFHVLEQQQKQKKRGRPPPGLFEQGGLEAAKKDNEYRPKKEEVAQFLEFLYNLETEMDKFAKEPPEGAARVEDLPGTVFPGKALVDLLQRAGFTLGNAQAVGLLIDRIGAYDMEKKIDAGLNVASSSTAFQRDTEKLNEFAVFLSRVFSIGAQPAGEEDPYSLFQLYFTRADDNALKFDFWCFSPKIAMRYLQNRQPLSIILASGTLSPIRHFISSMGIPFDFVLENGHAAKSEQVLVRPIERALNNSLLLGTFQNRSSADYVDGVGEMVSGLAQCVPQGMLVFFASYSQMKTFLEAWKRSFNGPSRWDQLAQLKTLCVEPSSRVEAPLIFREFDMAVREGKGAVMFAVCRGKMSEGIDFADCHCRAVTVVGIPYPPLKDPWVVLKKRFLAQRFGRDRTQLSAEEWYKIEAVRAVNQALGRIIRHKDDFGVVVLADSRFGSMAPAYFPAWVRPSLRTEPEPKRLFAEVRRFFGERSLQVEQSMRSVAMNPATSFNNPLKRAHLSLQQEQDVEAKKQRAKENFERMADLYSDKPTGSTSSAQTVVKKLEPAQKSTFFSAANPAAKPRRKLMVTTSNNSFSQPPKPK